MNFVAGEEDDLKTPVLQRDSLQQVLSELEAEAASQPKGTFYYRGQIARRQLLCSCDIPRLGQAFPAFGKPTFKFESFVPSRYRSYIVHRTDGTTPLIRWPQWTPQSPLGEVSVVARALMESHDDNLRHVVRQYFLDVAKFPEIVVAKVLAMKGAALQNPPPPSLLAPGTNMLKSFLTLVSWAQHYEFGSIMVDVTSSPAVAGWFASHRWSGEVATDDQAHGVIYRFDYNKIRSFLEKELEHETSAASLIRALGFLGLADISGLPIAGGKRPSAQCGGSFLGLENVIISYLFSVYGGLTIYTVPLGSVTGRETGYTKADLCPPDDTALRLFSLPDTSVGPLTSGEIKRFVDCEEFTKDEQRFLVRSFEHGLL